MKAIYLITPFQKSLCNTAEIFMKSTNRKKTKRHSTCLAESAVCDFKQADEALSCGQGKKIQVRHYNPHDKTLWKALIFWFVLHQGKMNIETLIFSSFCIKAK